MRSSNPSQSGLCHILLLVWRSNSSLYPSSKIFQLEYFFPRLINNEVKAEELPIEASNAVMLPIPLHHVRRRDRGFNQAAVIARELAQQWNLTMDESLLKRKKYTKTQTTLTIQERQENMYMAFQTAQNTPKAVILVDDVLTTGSTADACGSRLRENGCKWVGIVTLATPKLKKKYR